LVLTLNTPFEPKARALNVDKAQATSERAKLSL
jgi:hypothetical protein